MAQIFRFAAIHVPDFESLRFQALNRKLTVLFAANLGLVPGADQIGEEVRRFRVSEGLTAEQAFLQWLRNNDLTEEEFLPLIGEIATCRLVHRWWLSASAGYGQRAKLVLDELKLQGKYRPVVQAAAQLSDAAPDCPEPDVQTCTKTEVASLVREHARQTGFRLDIPIQSGRRKQDISLLRTC